VRTEDFILIGEDLSWCTKAINSGFDVWVDPNVRVIHQKTFPLPFMSQIQK
jgi:GT2 family glycosyltransferase